MKVKVQILVTQDEYDDYVREYEVCNNIKPTIEKIDNMYKDELCANFNDYIHCDNIEVRLAAAPLNEVLN